MPLLGEGSRSFKFLTYVRSSSPVLVMISSMSVPICNHFTRESSYCFHRVLVIAILSVRLSVRSSHGWNEIGSKLLLITNRKSYTGSRLAPHSMTLNDFERQNRGFYGFVGDFRLRHKVAPR